MAAGKFHVQPTGEDRHLLALDQNMSYTFHFWTFLAIRSLVSIDAMSVQPFHEQCAPEAWPSALIPLAALHALFFQITSSGSNNFMLRRTISFKFFPVIATPAGVLMCHHFARQLFSPASDGPGGFF